MQQSRSSSWNWLVQSNFYCLLWSDNEISLKLMGFPWNIFIQGKSHFMIRIIYNSYRYRIITPQATFISLTTSILCRTITNLQHFSILALTLKITSLSIAEGESFQMQFVLWIYILCVVCKLKSTFSLYKSILLLTFSIDLSYTLFHSVIHSFQKFLFVLVLPLCYL